MISVIAIKHGVHSLRPWGIVQSPESFSFPSGHTTLTTTFYIGLALLMSHAYTGKSRKFFYALIALIILAVSISRLYLGAHWFTDIVGGWILSIALLILVTISFNRKVVTVNSRKLLLITMLLLGSIYIFAAQHYIPQLQINFTQLDLPIQETELKVWDKQNSTYLPEQRDWLDVLFRLSGIQSAEHLPLISPLYLDKKPALVLIRNIPSEKKLLVLRLWQSNIILKGTKEPLWVGIVGLVPKTYGWILPLSSYLTTKDPG